MATMMKRPLVLVIIWLDDEATEASSFITSGRDLE